MADYKLLGKNYQTPDLVAKVTGKAKYAEDYRADGMVFVKLLLSPRPHARVTRIDASAALAMPGVHGIITADDLPAAPAPSARAARGVRPGGRGPPPPTLCRGPRPRRPRRPRPPRPPHHQLRLAERHR